jgi:hypothetical protein
VRVAKLPAASGSSSPNLTRGAEELHLAWMSQAGEPRLELASLALNGGEGVASGAGWSEPLTVSSGPRLLINWADVPAVGETASGRVVVAWPEYHGDDPAAGYGLRVAAALDDGSFGPAWSPDEVRRGPESGFSGFVTTAEGLRMFWLDGRDLHGSSDGGSHGSGTMTLRSVLIDDEGRQLGPSIVLDARTCECCKLGVGLAGGRAFAAYRDRSEAEVRDIYVAGPGRSPLRVAEDGWTIAGCPVNGPAVASAPSPTQAELAWVAWYTGAEDRAATFVASGSPARGFAAPVRFDLGLPAGRVDAIATPEGGALLSWFELDPDQPGRARLLARRVAADGRLGESVEIAAVGAARDWGFPRAALLGAGDESEVLWVFTDPAAADGLSRVEARVGPLPPA